MKSTDNRLNRYSLKDSMVIQLLAIGMCLCLLVISQKAESTNYFHWGIESNKVDACCMVFNNILSYRSGTSRVTDTAHSGSYSMKLQVIGNDSGNQSMGTDMDWNRMPFNIVGGPALYYRWWMKIMPGFSWGNGTYKTKSSRVLGATAPRVYTGYVEKDGFYVAECEDVGVSLLGGGCLDANGIPNNDYHIRVNYDMTKMADSQWHEYIVMVKPNTTTTSMDAQLKVWVDDTQVGQYLNWRLHNVTNNQMIEAWGGWMVEPYFQLNGTASDGGTIYLDDFSVDDSYNSLISGGILSAPTNLRAIP